jgi:hypothetical protein
MAERDIFKERLEIDWKVMVEDNDEHEDHIIKSLIMHKSLGIENLLNLIIINHFIKKKWKDFFLEDVLFDGAFTVNLKIKMIGRSKIMDTHKIKRSLIRLFEIRNMVAHDTITQDHKIWTKKEQIELRRLYTEFSSKYDKVFSILLKLSGVSITRVRQ